MEGCTFRQEQITNWIPNRSNTITGNRSRKDWTNSRVAIAQAAWVGVESKNAGRKHVRFWNDYHVVNVDAGDGITRGAVGNLVGKSLICRATVLVILQQTNRRWLKDEAARATRASRAARVSTISRRELW